MAALAEPEGGRQARRSPADDHYPIRARGRQAS
jgi:hypothetical protein